MREAVTKRRKASTAVESFEALRQGKPSCCFSAVYSAPNPPPNPSVNPTAQQRRFAPLLGSLRCAPAAGYLQRYAPLPN